MNTKTLPHWNMTVVYPSLDSPEFEAAFNDLVEKINTLARLFDEYGIARRDEATVDGATVKAFETVIEKFNALLEVDDTLGAYIMSFITTDSRNTTAQAKLSALQQHSVLLSKLGTRFTAWIGSLDLEVLLERSELARQYSYLLERAHTEAAHLMSPIEEDLAAELNLSGGTAWGRLYGDVTSQLAVTIELDGKTQELPMSAVRNLALDPRRDVRKQAYDAELAAWEKSAVPLAAALNSIKGQVNTLSGRRHWDAALDEAVFEAAIDRETLDAMMNTARESFPDFRRYLRAKARVLGLPQLAWYDISAPIGESARVWSYEDARDFILTHFGTFSDKMQGLAKRAFEEEWIDAEPRAGKRDGAFCMRVRRDESRILSNFKPTYSGMRTLAHELGHAYHNLVISDRPALLRNTPMTLAETASIFCEMIVRESAMRDESADANEQRAILEAFLESSCQVVVDISSRYLFEQSVFEKRAARESSAQELCKLMLDAQKDTYGDGVDETQLHPYMWAVKGHYYSTGRSFYNFPYMFGLLFSLGLYARYQQNAAEFKKGYDELLSSTGMADAATLGARFGIDLHTPDFWRASLDVIRGEIDRFEALTS